MKTFALCAACGCLAFVAVQYQMTGQVLGLRMGDDGSPVAAPPARVTFPDALAALCQGKGVPQAAAFDKKGETHPAVVLKPNGSLHSWYKRLQPGWLAESVEETELVIVVPKQKRTLLSVHAFVNMAPSIRRYQHDVDVRVLEAQTGKVIAQKHFQNVARPIRPIEPYALTELGDPVPWIDVSRWVKNVTARSSAK